MKLSSPYALLLLLILNVTVLLPQLGSCYDPIGYRCEAGSSVPTQANIDGLLSQLVANVTDDKFAIASYGNGDSALYGLLQCRADVPSAVCAKCARDASRNAKSLCRQTERQARVWFDFCYIRYDATNFVGKLDTDYSVVYINPGEIPDANMTFTSKVDDLMNVVVTEAAKGGQSIGLSLSTYSSKVVIWALAQCTRDLNPVLCRNCLDTAISYMQPYKLKKGFQVNYGSCNIHYEIHPFFYPFIKN